MRRGGAGPGGQADPSPGAKRTHCSGARAAGCHFFFPLHFGLTFSSLVQWIAFKHILKDNDSQRNASSLHKIGKIQKNAKAPVAS